MDTINKLQQIMQDASWSQEELAHQLGVAHKTLSSWLKQKASPRSEHLENIDRLYLAIVGRPAVSHLELAEAENQVLNAHTSVDELITNPELLRAITIYLTYHTNTIEGSTMTLEDVEQVLDDENVTLTNRTAREQIEARNHRAALNFLLTQIKKQGPDFIWNVDLIRALHLRLMNSLIENAGNFRLHGVRILGARVPLANVASVPDKVNQLIEYMNTPYGNLVERLAVTHALFEQIHPFSDGNGRTGRLIMFGQAITAGIMPPLVLKERKRAYYRYLEQAQMYEDYDLLRMFIAESIVSTERILEAQAN